jgi:hypothetical protein
MNLKELAHKNKWRRPEPSPEEISCAK